MLRSVPLPRVSVVCPVLLLAATLPLFAQVDATIRINNDRLQGTHPNGQVLLYSPDPVQPGSSISHWDPSATPNLLMEPFASSSLPFLELDITPGQMEDIGWNRGTSTINIVPLDSQDVGFTDPRPFPGAPGNTAETLGAARVNLFNAVLGAWANTLESSVDIDVLVTWLPLPCEPGVGAVIGAASTIFVFSDASGEAFPFADVLYPAALAEALAGEDLTGSPEDDGGDIIVFMNSDIDNGCLGEGTGFYYGLDGNSPPNLIAVASVVLHEMGHGLGFSSFTDETTGELLVGMPGIFDVFTFDTLIGETWVEMTDAERRRSAINVRNLTWAGARANAAASATLAPGVPELAVTAPPEVAGAYAIGTAAFGAPIPATGLAGEIACMKDGVDLAAADFTALNGCQPATNPEELAGKIALIDRGVCTFTTKVAHAQAAGAIGAIIVNNAGNTPLGLGGDDPSLTIPAVSLGRRDGNRIRQAACAEAATFLSGDRFQVSAQWAAPDGASGLGSGVMLTDTTGYFYFFSPENVEVTVKVLDACNDPEFNRFWVFAAGMTNVEVSLTVIDTQAGQVNTYFNPQGRPFQPIQDTDAFATCP